jgi:hypothetical protein
VRYIPAETGWQKADRMFGRGSESAQATIVARKVSKGLLVASRQQGTGLRATEVPF